MAVTSDGTSSATIPVSETRIRSWPAGRRAPRGRRRWWATPTPPRFHEELEVHRQAAVGGQQVADGRDLEVDLALVVGGAAGVQAAVANGRLERWGRPLLQRVGRLHVVVAVHGDRRRLGPRPATRRRRQPSVASTSVSSPAASISPARCSAERRTSGACSGSLEIEGMAHHSASSAASASASACTKASMSAMGISWERAEVDQTARQEAPGLGAGRGRGGRAVVGSLPVRLVILSCWDGVNGADRHGRRGGRARHVRTLLARDRPAAVADPALERAKELPPGRGVRLPQPHGAAGAPSAWTPSTSASPRSPTAPPSWP